MPSIKRLSLVLPAIVLAVALAACSTSSSVSTVPSVELPRYLGTWYEIASVKQFFSIGLVDTTATYSLNGDGSVKVENAGRYGPASGPVSSIVGNAVALDASNARLNVAFPGPAATTGPGNYWIVDLDPDYQWAIVSDPTGQSAFLLSRTKAISPALKAELLARAAAKGVNTANITDTPQP